MQRAKPSVVRQCAKVGTFSRCASSTTATDFLRRHAHAFGDRTGVIWPAGDNQLHRVGIRASGADASGEPCPSRRPSLRPESAGGRPSRSAAAPPSCMARQSAEFARTRCFQVEQRPVASRVAQRRHAAFQGLVRPLRRAERAQGRRFIDVVNSRLRRRVKFQMDVRVDNAGNTYRADQSSSLGFRIQPVSARHNRRAARFFLPARAGRPRRRIRPAHKSRGL